MLIAQCLMPVPVAEIQVMKRPDGSDWELGSGGFGKVFKALRNGVQPVAVKVLLVSHLIRCVTNESQPVDGATSEASNAGARESSQGPVGWLERSRCP